MQSKKKEKNKKRKKKNKKKTKSKQRPKCQAREGMHAWSSHLISRGRDRGLTPILGEPQGPERWASSGPKHVAAFGL